MSLTVAPTMEGGDFGKYELISKMGSGYGDVATTSLAKKKGTSQVVAIKRINLEKLDRNIAPVEHEIAITRQLRHENILPYYETFVTDKEIWAVMPLLPYGSARDLICAHFVEGLPEIAVAIMLRDVLQALDYIHSRGIIHRSVKAGHMLVSARGKVLLSGFRYSYHTMRAGQWEKTTFDYPADVVANLNWLSPELLEQNLLGYDAKSDIYSVGIAACELANGFVPFADMPPTQMLIEKLRGASPRPIDSTTYFTLIGHSQDELNDSATNGGNSNGGMRPNFSTNSLKDLDRENITAVYRERTFNSSFHHFVEMCLLRDPVGRQSAVELLNHVFMRQLYSRRINTYLPDLLLPITPITEASTFLQESQICDDFSNLDCGDPGLGEVQWTF